MINSTKMRTVHIREQLKELGVSVDEINFGFFDVIGELTARRTRGVDSDGFKKHGAYYRANYERGILIYYLVRELKVASMLEVGFGRGYGSACALAAMKDFNIDGTVTTIDPLYDEDQLVKISKLIPSVGYRLKYINGTSRQVFDGDVLNGETYDFAYIDGDHSEEGVQYDAEHILPIVTKAVLFDDYHIDDQEDHIRCQKAIDKIDLDKTLIIMDRRLYTDDRGMTDEEIRYGQVLITK